MLLLALLVLLLDRRKLYGDCICCTLHTDMHAHWLGERRQKLQARSVSNWRVIWDDLWNGVRNYCAAARTANSLLSYGAVTIKRYVVADCSFFVGHVWLMITILVLVFVLRVKLLRDGVRVLKSHHLLIFHWLELLWLDWIDQVSFIRSLGDRMPKTFLRDQSIKLVSQGARVLREAHISLLIQIICDHRILTINS